MHTALRLLNLAMVVLALVAAGNHGAEQDAAHQVGRWSGAAMLAAAPLLTVFGLRRGASRRLRTAASFLNGLLLVLICIGGLSAALLQQQVLRGLLGASVIAVLCALNGWGLRSLSRQEDGGGEDAEGRLAGRYWRGELPLGVMFWVGGGLVLLIQVVQMIIVGLLADRVSMRVGATLVLTMFLVSVLLIAWHAVGVWRSATRHSRDGAWHWAALAKIALVTGSLAFGFLVVKVMWLPLRENLLIAAGKDRLAPIEARLTTSGSVLLLHGTFGTGSAEVVRRLLDESPEVKTVALASGGGRLREAADVAAMVRLRGLDTYVDTRCESACTFVFLAGKDRAATPNARIGFHRPSFAGVTPLAFDPATDSMMATYRRAGIPGEFLDRVAATEPANMWYPTPSELETAGVINRVSLGGETSAIGFLASSSRGDLEKAFRGVPMMAAMERHFPGTIDEAVRAAWMERNQGGRDAAVSNAAREVIAARYPKILAAANDASLDQFAGIMVDQMKAASAISVEACRLLLAGQLNIAQVLAPQLVQREHDWALDVLKAESLVEREPVDALEFDRTMADATSRLAPGVLEVVAAPDDYDDQPGRQCEAMIRLYDHILKLPPAQRHLLLRGMFQAGAL